MCKEAIKDSKHICVKCLKEKKDVKTYFFNERGYGSCMDGISTKFQFCDECKPDNLDEILNEEPTIENGYIENYKLEDSLMDLIDSLDVRGQELIMNCWTSGIFSDSKLEPEDWILIATKKAPDSLYKKYGMYTPSEMNACEEKYPKCENVFNIVYSDGSKGSKCILGNYKGYNTDCLTCSLYKERTTGIETLTPEEFNKKFK